MSSYHIGLISTPWAIFNRPSIQLGALKAYLGQVLPTVTVETRHPYLDIANVLSPAVYKDISEKPWAAEALYSPLLFPDQYDDALTLFSSQMKGSGYDFQAILKVIEQEHSRWLDQQSDIVAKWSMAGFSVCFSQLIPSLYLAKHLKKKFPHLQIAFGGSTCTPSLAQGLVKEFPFIDHVINGEGEGPLTYLVRELQQKKEVGTGCPSCDSSELPDLKVLPTPDYTCYFRELSRLQFTFIPRLPIEFSRGCWWNKCSFCNLNLQWCGYRKKTAEQVMMEVDELSQRYGILDFNFTDNALPLQEARRFFDRVAQGKRSFQFFGEIRTLPKQQDYDRFAQGGLTTIQVGIEALSSSLLEKMAKGTTVLDNVVAMRSAAEAGIQLEGNLILEFPGSTEQEVDETMEMLESIMVYPPLEAASFFLGQGSPVSFNSKEFGISALTSHPHNRRLYPRRVLEKLDMLIKGYRGDRLKQRKQWKPVRKKLVVWQEFYRKSRPILPLTYRDGGSFLLIRQETHQGEVLHHRLKGTSRAIYLSCLQPVTCQQLLTSFPKVTEAQLLSFLTDLCREKIMLQHEDRFLALAINNSNKKQTFS